MKSINKKPPRGQVRAQIFSGARFLEAPRASGRCFGPSIKSPYPLEKPLWEFGIFRKVSGRYAVRIFRDCANPRSFSGHQLASLSIYNNMLLSKEVNALFLCYIYSNVSKISRNYGL
jgi:hypothetical protein